MKLTILEWNIHKMTKKADVEPFVCNRILLANADINCLVEYIDDMGIRENLQEKYWLEESNTASGNKILLAIKKAVVPNGIELVNKEEVFECYNFLHLNLQVSDSCCLSVIGIRMLSPMDALKQTPPLNAYLKNISNPYVCLGDFNILGFRMNHWFPNSHFIKTKEKSDSLENCSIIYVDKNTKYINGFGDVDHIISSSSPNNVNVIDAKYKWDFLEDSTKYPCKKDIEKGKIWSIDPGYPDHAMLFAEISFAVLPLL